MAVLQMSSSCSKRIKGGSIVPEKEIPGQSRHNQNNCPSRKRVRAVGRGEGSERERETTRTCLKKSIRGECQEIRRAIPTSTYGQPKETRVTVYQIDHSLDLSSLP